MKARVQSLFKKLDGCLDRWLCRIGVHYWSHPGGSCTSCGKKDDLYY